MTTSSKSVNQVGLLTASQIAQFKRDGYLVLPAVLDPDLCRQARDQMWETIAANLPRMKRDDPSTWTPITEEESSRPRVPPPVGVEDPYFAGRDHKLSVRNGTEQLILDLAPRALWQVAEQLLGAGTLVWPAGSDESGFNSGPCFMDDDIMGNLVNHMGAKAADLPEPSFTTEAMRLPATGPTWINGQGTRGLYCTLPQSPPHAADYPSAHSDGACYGRVRLQLSAYIDDVGPNCGAFNVWPGSHARIWPEQWKAFKAGEKHTDKHLPVRMAGGYRDPVIGQIKADTEPVDCHGPAGTVVLWHTKILHIPGQNCSTDVLRQATIYGYLKTLEALPDALVVDDTDGDIWRDWSDEVRAISTSA